MPKRARVPSPRAFVYACFVLELSAREKGDGDGEPGRALCARCMRAACEHGMPAHVCAGPRVQRAMLMLVLCALSALSGIIALFYALCFFVVRARAMRLGGMSAACLDGSPRRATPAWSTISTPSEEGKSRDDMELY